MASNSNTNMTTIMEEEEHENIPKNTARHTAGELRAGFWPLFSGSNSYFLTEQISGNTCMAPYIYHRRNLGLPIYIEWRSLSSNPHPLAVDLLMENPNKICWYLLSANPSKKAVDFLYNNYPDKIDWRFMSSNPYAIDIILEKKEKICWPQLCRNTDPKAIELLEKNLDKVDWYILSNNRSKEAMDLLYKNISKLDSWFKISSNPCAMEILLKYPNRINWDELSSNPHPIAMEMLINNWDKINWCYLSSNTNATAIKMLLDNPSRINWYWFSSNPGAIDYLERNINHPELDYSALLCNPALCYNE